MPIISTVQNVLANCSRTRSIERKSAPIRKAGAVDEEVEKKTIKTFKECPNLSVRVVADKVGTSASTVHRTKAGAALKTYEA